MIYFDNAGTSGKKPDNVERALKNVLSQTNANVGRSGHKLAVIGAENVFKARYEMARFFGCVNSEKVIFTKNCTEALNIAILGSAQKGDHYITTSLEHNSVLRPLQFLKEQGMIEYDIAGINERGEIETDSIINLLKPNTKAVVCTLASNVNAKGVTIESLSKKLPENILLICDGAQAVGHKRIDVKKHKIDALAIAGHKGLYGIQGSGALLLSERFNPKPIMYGGTGSESYNLNMPNYYPDLLESGTLNYPSIISMYEGILYLSVHQEYNEKYLYNLTEYIHKNLLNEKIKLYTEPNGLGICSFNINGYESSNLANVLSQSYNIATRGGLHCAPITHKALGTFDIGGCVRVSLSPFNTAREVEYFVQCISKIIK